MYLSNNYVDINIYPLTMNVMRLWACLYGKGAISNDNIIIIIIIINMITQNAMWTAMKSDAIGQWRTSAGWKLRRIT